MLADLTTALEIDWKTPWKELDEEKRRALLHGDGLEDAGKEPRTAVIPSLRRMEDETDSKRTKRKLKKYKSDVQCPECGGARLRPEPLAVTVGGNNIHEVCHRPVSDMLEFFEDLSLDGARARIARPILREITDRLGFMLDVGLHYLHGDRLTSTLSRGEMQRVRLATQIGSDLTGILYVLDEPTIGLHFRDNARLLNSLHRLRDAGNTIVVVEHDELTIRESDWALDLGPGAGRKGGEVIYNGPVDELEDCEDSITADYLAGRRTIEIPERQRERDPDRELVVRGATEHNLKDIDVTFPLGLFCCVTGVSGSGKSTLVQDILYRTLARKLYRSRPRPGAHEEIEGLDKIDRVLEIDQTPVGRSPRSTPATYTKVFDHIREVFAETRQAQVRGYDRGRFSFNTQEGKCQVCSGRGEKKVEMSFLPDMAVTCEECGGRRYNEETLQVTMRGKNIADILEMTVTEALEFFTNYPPIVRRLRTLRDVGLGYLKLGQPSPTLSGGEAQRIKLARELGKKSRGETVYIFDEPTTGLHFEDVKKLLKTLHGLADRGNTLIVIEHNLEVIKNADYIVDLGPEGGEGGGEVVVSGAVEQVADCEASHTGEALRQYFEGLG